MAVDKLVDSAQLDADLTSVANAIRTKGGTSSQMAFPAGFVSAVQAIPTGITPTGTKAISITQNGTTTEDVTNYASAEITVNVSGGGSDENFEKLLNNTLVTVDNSNLTSLRQGAFANSTNLATVNLSNVTSATHEIFKGCTNLREVHMTKWAGNIGNDCLFNNKKLEVFDAPNITQAGNNAFAYCEKLTLQILPKFTTMNGTILFRNCPFTVMVLPMLTTAKTNMLLTCNNCVTVDIGENLDSIPAQMLNGNAVLENIVLRRTSSITALSNANGLWGNSNEPSVHKKIYVPSALISTYQTATNWVTHYNAGYITFHAIEGSIYANAYADGTPISS